MTRVVADSNIIVSALRFGGKPEKFLRAAEEGLYVLVLSDAILSETAEVLARKFGLTADRAASHLGRIRKSADLIVTNLTIAACVDPDDDRILEAAVASGATHIVTGDKHLLRMKTFRGIDILTVSDFLVRMAAVTPERE